MSGRDLTSQGLDRRDQLLAAAGELFAEQGYAATRISDIAGAAGVAKGLLYWYFPSKEALLAAVAADVVHELRVLQKAVMVGLDDPLERFYAAVVVSVKYWHRHHRLFEALSLSRTKAPTRVFAQTVDRHMRDTARVLAEGQRLGVVRDGEDPERMALTVSAMVNELLHFHLLHILDEPFDEVAALTARSCVHLVAADPDAAAAVARAHDRLARHATVILERCGARHVAGRRSTSAR